MAEDARILTSLPTHPKTKKLKKRLGAEGCWSLICLFLAVADNWWDGNLSGQSTEDVELAADWKGEDGKFVKCLIEIGFLDGKDGEYSIHDWAEHNPYAAARGERVKKSKKAIAIRWAKPSNTNNKDENSTGIPKPQLSNSPATPATPLHSLPELGNGKKTNESENLESPADSEELILAIAKAHPDSGSVKGHKVPYLLQQQIISAIVSDSEELELTIEAATQRVLDLTRKYAETKRKFTWGINKFFEHRKYNLDSREWGGPESNFVPADNTKRESLLEITERALRS